MSSSLPLSGTASNVSSVFSFSSIQAPDSAQMVLDNCTTRIEQFIQKMKLGIPHENANLNKISCPITLEVPKDPVVTNCGHIYERAAIQQWKDKGGSCTLCSVPITALSPNHELRHLIETWQKEDPILTCSKFKNLDQQRADKYLKLAKSFVEETDYKEALESYSKALQYTNASEVYADIPRLYEQLGESKKTTLSRLYLALYQIQEGKTPEALQTLLSCESEDLKFNAFFEGLSLQSSQSQEKTGRALTNALHQESIEDKIFIYKQIIAHSPDQLEAYKQLIPLIKDPAEKKGLLAKATDQLTFWAKQFDVKAIFRSEEESPVFRFGTEQSFTSPKKQSPPLQRACESKTPDPNGTFLSEEETPLFRSPMFRFSAEKFSSPQQRVCESTTSDPNGNFISEKMGARRRVKRPCQQLVISNTPAPSPLIPTAITSKMWAEASTVDLPPYPQELKDFLAGECTIWPGKKRSETHIVVPLFPMVSIKGADPISLTLEALDQLDKNSGGPGYRFVSGTIPKNVSAEKEFRYAVMTSTVIPGSGSRPYDEQIRLLPAGYEAPGVLDAATAILWESRRSGKRYFTDSPRTYTRCKEKEIAPGFHSGSHLTVGGFVPSGLRISGYLGNSANLGLAGWRTF